MREFWASFKPSIISMVLFTLILGVIYPFLMFGVGQMLFHREANGSLFYYQNGTALGSELIAQQFAKPDYFHPRPSSAGTDGYDAANSSGSNLGPTSQKLSDLLHQRADAYRSENKLVSGVVIPIDAISASGSGLDPHISVANALLQAPRIAAARGMAEEIVKKLIVEYTENLDWGFLGENRINVLRINLALDKMKEGL